MHISSFSVENYKSLRQTDEVGLQPGFTVIIGQNNVGKTALMEALSLNFKSHPHRGLRTVPTVGVPIRGQSFVNVTFSLSRDDVISLLRPHGEFWVPSGGLAGGPADGFARAIARTNTLRTRWVNSELVSAELASVSRTPGRLHAAALRITPEGNVESARDALGHVDHDQLFDRLLANHIKAFRTYAFDAERLHLGMSEFGMASALRPDASNLPEVLSTLERNRSRFDRLVDLLRTILPAVRGISIQPKEARQVEILVWGIDPRTERVDLAIPLSECGTGIGQVLAILYVLIAAESPTIMLIDEPQSFLHPGAVRKLIEVLAQHSQHQFIITTHSPTAVTAADPRTLLRLHIVEGETAVERLSATEARDLRVVLADIGARLADVFGADSILWVEGLTEELCFPKILNRVLGKPLLGTAIVGVVHTADFEGRRSEATVELYGRLSAGRGLLPPAVGFIFDREGRSARDREDLERRGNISFLPRRMYENYLLNPRAIAAVASGIEGFRQGPTVEEEIQDWLDRHQWEARYCDPIPNERSGDVWVREVRGDRILPRISER